MEANPTPNRRIILFSVKNGRTSLEFLSKSNPNPDPSSHSRIHSNPLASQNLSQSRSLPAQRAHFNRRKLGEPGSRLSLAAKFQLQRKALRKSSREGRFYQNRSRKSFLRKNGISSNSLLPKSRISKISRFASGTQQSQNSKAKKRQKIALGFCSFSNSKIFHQPEIFRTRRRKNENSKSDQSTRPSIKNPKFGQSTRPSLASGNFSIEQKISEPSRTKRISRQNRSLDARLRTTSNANFSNRQRGFNSGSILGERNFGNSRERQPKIKKFDRIWGKSRQKNEIRNFENFKLTETKMENRIESKIKKILEILPKKFRVRFLQDFSDRFLVFDENFKKSAQKILQIRRKQDSKNFNAKIIKKSDLGSDGFFERLLVSFFHFKLEKRKFPYFFNDFLEEFVVI